MHCSTYLKRKFLRKASGVDWKTLSAYLTYAAIKKHHPVSPNIFLSNWSEAHDSLVCAFLQATIASDYYASVQLANKKANAHSIGYVGVRWRKMRGYCNLKENTKNLLLHRNWAFQIEPNPSFEKLKSGNKFSAYSKSTSLFWFRKHREVAIWLGRYVRAEIKSNKAQHHPRNSKTVIKGIIIL